MTDLRISVLNTSADGGTALTPLWFAAHNEGFRVYTRNTEASAGLEALAEDGSFDTINAEVTAFDSDAITGAVIGARGPIAAQEVTTATVNVDGSVNPYLSLAAMILPSNDAFVGTGQALRLFDEDGNFLGAQNLIFEGSDVLDAGTELNTEEDAAFLNQTAPNTGLDENGVVTDHPGFLPEGQGNILGGTNAFGELIDPVAADFTREGAQIAQVHINEFVQTEGDDGFDFIVGSRADDQVFGNGGRDVLLGRSGWDQLNGGDGNDLLKGGAGNDILSGGSGRDVLVGGRDDDLLFGDDGRDILKGGSGTDQLEGGSGRDTLFGGADSDHLTGGDGRDRLYGNSGNDVLAGGTGRDHLVGGRGEDVFVFATGDQRDRIVDFDIDDDSLALKIDGIDSLDAVLDAARGNDHRTVLDFGDGDRLILSGVDIDDLSSITIDLF